MKYDKLKRYLYVMHLCTNRKLVMVTDLVTRKPELGILKLNSNPAPTTHDHHNNNIIRVLVIMSIHVICGVIYSKIQGQYEMISIDVAGTNKN